MACIRELVGRSRSKQHLSAVPHVSLVWRRRRNRSASATLAQEGQTAIPKAEDRCNSTDDGRSTNNHSTDAPSIYKNSASERHYKRGQPASARSESTESGIELNGNSERPHSEKQQVKPQTSCPSRDQDRSENYSSWHACARMRHYEHDGSEFHAFH